MFATLAESGINIEIISTSSIRSPAIVARARVERAVQPCTTRSSSADDASGACRAAIGVVGATGAVGTVTLDLLARARLRGRARLRVGALGRQVARRAPVEEATPEALSRGDVDLFLFSVGTRASRELVPHAVARRRGRDRQVVCLPARARRPARRPRGQRRPRARARRDRREPELLHDPADLRAEAAARGRRLARVRVATYQSVSGAGAQAMERLRDEPQDEHDLRMDWDFDGEEFDEESKLRDETRKIMELPDLPIRRPASGCR